MRRRSTASSRASTRSRSGGEHYAFTQFEAIAARRAFPCSTSRAFKTPFDVDAHGAAGGRRRSRTREVVRGDAGGRGMKRIRFATTEPLPTYLVAMAVGPLDVVEAPPIPPNAVRTRPLPVPRHRREGTRRGRSRYALRADAGDHRRARAVLRHRVPVRQARHRRGAGLFGGRDGERRARHVPRVAPAARREQRRGEQKRAFACVMAHELAHSGSAIWSRCRGGTTSGSTRRSPRGWRARSCARSTPTITPTSRRWSGPRARCRRTA